MTPWRYPYASFSFLLTAGNLPKPISLLLYNQILIPSGTRPHLLPKALIIGSEKSPCLCYQSLAPSRSVCSSLTNNGYRMYWQVTIGLRRTYNSLGKTGTRLDQPKISAWMGRSCSASTTPIGSPSHNWWLIGESRLFLKMQPLRGYPCVSSPACMHV